MEVQMDLNNLLYALSEEAVDGGLSKKTFRRRVSSVLNQHSLGHFERWNIERTLVALGHLDITDGIYRLHPPTLLKLPEPIDKYTHCLVGARSPGMKKWLETFSIIVQEQQGRPIDEREKIMSPSQILCREINRAKIENRIRIMETDIGYPKIASSKTVEDFKNGVDFSPDLPEILRDWKEEPSLRSWDFDGEGELFDEFNGGSVSRPYDINNRRDAELVVVKSGFGSEHYILHVDGKYAEIEYQNRYLAKHMILKEHNICRLTYNPSTMKLQIDLSPPLPIEIHSGLCLCSGTIPELSQRTIISSSKRKRVLQYCNVPAQYAVRVAHLLGFKVEQVQTTDSELS